MAWSSASTFSIVKVLAFKVKLTGNNRSKHTYEPYKLAVCVERTGGRTIRAIILAAGRGERFGHLTELVPKPLLPVGGQTLLWRLVQALHEAGLEDTSVGIGWKGEDVRLHLQQDLAHTPSRSVMVEGYRTGPLQTLVTSLGSELSSPTLICPSDLLMSSRDLARIVGVHSTNPPSIDLTIAIDAGRHNGTKVYVRGSDVVSLGQERSGCQVIGVSAMVVIANPSFLCFCKEALGAGLTTVQDAINSFLDQRGKARYAAVTDPWFDIDSVASLLEANKWVLDNAPAPSNWGLFLPQGDEMEFGETLGIGDGIQIGSGTQIIGGSLVSKATSIGTDSVIGPNVYIGSHCAVGNNCHIQDSIILDNTVVSDGTAMSRVVLVGRHTFRGE
jgi:mannose-1-phosphate guanylyltransferase